MFAGCLSLIFEEGASLIVADHGRVLQSASSLTPMASVQSTEGGASHESPNESSVLKSARVEAINYDYCRYGFWLNPGQTLPHGLWS